MCKNPQMCKQPHLCKHFALKCANDHICANTAPSTVQIGKNTSPTINVQTWRRQMCKRSILTWNVHSNIPHMCKSLFLLRINHICANISPSIVPTTTFVQTFHPQMCKQPHLCKHSALKMCKSVKIYQPLMCKHVAVKMSKGSIWLEMCNWHPTKCANHCFHQESISF